MVVAMLPCALPVLAWDTTIPPTPKVEAKPPEPLSGDPPVLFTDVTTEVGIDFVETIGDDRMTNIVESTGVGCGFLDYDGDGWMDIYLVSGCWKAGISDPDLDPKTRDKLVRATDRLYRNLGGSGTVRFEDVTIRAGLNRPGYGMGVVAADYDGDGDRDIYVTNHGPNFLYRNNGDGTFDEVAKAAGVDDPAFSVGTVFLDYDRDGRLDLYVGNYLTYDPGDTPEHARDIVRSPLAYTGQQDHLYRNNGDGTFADVTRQAGLEIKPIGRAMGVGAFDYDNDGFLDVFVSNDAMENFLLHNKASRSAAGFENGALLAGAAFSEAGDAAAAMAVEIADYDGDGWLDVLAPDMNLCCLYRNLGGRMFDDVAVQSGLAVVMSRHHGWGGVLADFDLDGHLDAYIATGNACHLEGHPDRLFLGDGRGRLQHVSDQAGQALGTNRVSRGVARADFDNDGDVDLLVNHLNDRPALLRNDTLRRGRHWLTVELVGRAPNQDAIGAVVKVITGNRIRMQPRLSGGSYLSNHDPRMHFGIGAADEIDRIEVTWPDGSSKVIEHVVSDRRVIIHQQTATQAGVK